MLSAWSFAKWPEFISEFEIMGIEYGSAIVGSSYTNDILCATLKA